MTFPWKIDGNSRTGQTSLQQMVFILQVGMKKHSIPFKKIADELSDAKDAYKRGDYTTAMLSFEKLAEQGDAEAMIRTAASGQ